MARECCCCAAVCSLICPPLAVLMMEGCGVQFCLNLLLTLLFFIPGLIHACIVLNWEDKPRIAYIGQAAQPPVVVVHHNV